MAGEERMFVVSMDDHGEVSRLAAIMASIGAELVTAAGAVSSVQLIDFVGL